jgi:hypothetical protein
MYKFLCVQRYVVQRKDFFYEHSQGIQKTSPSGENTGRAMLLAWV